MWLGILLTLTSCAPFGVVSIIYACKVNQLWASGDYAGARKASSYALRWALIGVAVLVAGLLFVWLSIELSKSPGNPNPNIP
jgi:hypothetical protein